MKNKLEFGWSSFLVSAPVLVGSLLLCVLAAFFKQTILATALMFLFLFGGVARIWAFASARRISIAVTGTGQGLFPGETVTFEIEICNDKFLPVIWMEMFFPLSRDLCITPEHCHKPDDWDVSGLKDDGYSTELVSEKRLSFLLWYEKTRVTSCWTANHRGIYSTEGWHLRTGDGFGITQVTRNINQEAVRQFAVYPKLIPVKPDIFLRNQWNADTGIRGVMEDVTVIRSTRDYLTTDSLKRINWRLAARGLPLTVNTYEDILPRSIHFVFDGESFSGPTPHLEELEDALSILASEIVRLTEAQMPCGLSLCKGEKTNAVNFSPMNHAEPLLWAMAAYQPLPPQYDTDQQTVIQQLPTFDEASLYEMSQRIGRMYYISYDGTFLKENKLLRSLDSTQVSLLTYRATPPYGEYETLCLCHLKEGQHHG